MTTRIALALASALLFQSCAMAVPPRKPGGPSAPRTYFPPAPPTGATPPALGGTTSIARPAGTPAQTR